MGYVLALWGEFVKFTGGRAGLVHLLLFAAALVCCFFLGKEERHRLFWPSVLVGIFFFNPVFYKYVGTRFLSGVYWRLLWMLPWTFVIAYAVVRMAYRLCCGGGGMCLYLRDREAGFIGGDLRGAVECVRTAAGSS